jgi:methionyl-tRNA formyltransferase
VRAVVFAYHEIGYVCLEELINFGAEVLCLFTHRDDPNEQVWFKTPAIIAEETGIPVCTPETLKDPYWMDVIKDQAPDFIFSFYYRNMIPKRILDIPSAGAFNLHGSLLPRFRGRSPVNWVLVKGETKTGLTLHYMEEKPDTGDIVAQRAIDIAMDDTAHSLFLKMIDAARPLMREILPSLDSRTFTAVSQAGLGPSSYYGGRKPEDGLISWEKDSPSIYNLVRAVTHPYPGAFTYVDGKKLFIWWAGIEPAPSTSPDALPGTVYSVSPVLVKTGDGALRLATVQLEGEKEMSAEEFAVLHNLKDKTLGGNR